MGKIILEFDSVEESLDAQTALDGHKWKSAMWELDQELRRTVKYGKSTLNPSEDLAGELERELADKYREKIREILEGYGVMFD